MHGDPSVDAAIARYLSEHPDANNIIVVPVNKIKLVKSKKRITARGKGVTKFGRWTPGMGRLS